MKMLQLIQINELFQIGMQYFIAKTPISENQIGYRFYNLIFQIQNMSISMFRKLIWQPKVLVG